MNALLVSFESLFFTLLHRRQVAALRRRMERRRVEMEKCNERERKNAFFVLLIKKGEQLPRWQLGCGQLDMQPMRGHQAKFRLEQSLFFFG